MEKEDVFLKLKIFVQVKLFCTKIKNFRAKLHDFLKFLTFYLNILKKS